MYHFPKILKKEARTEFTTALSVILYSDKNHSKHFEKESNADFTHFFHCAVF